MASSENGWKHFECRVTFRRAPLIVFQDADLRKWVLSGGTVPSLLVVVFGVLSDESNPGPESNPRLPGSDLESYTEATPQQLECLLRT